MRRHRIDTHSHFLPDYYREALQANGHTNPDGMPAVPPWSEAAHLEMMDQLNIEKSIISISSPGVFLRPDFGDSAVALARRCNSTAADLKRRHPTRFGFFATTPLPLIQETIEEIDRALADGADGIGLETNHEGIYLGDKRFDAVFAELDARKAKVFIHPTMPCFCPAGTEGAGTAQAIKANPLRETLPAPVMEFLFDTARCVANLFLSGTITKYPSITYLIPHMGGTMASLLPRFLGFARIVPGQSHAKWEDEDAIAVLNSRFYFDMAGWAFPTLDKALIDGLGVKLDRILYGSDYPFTPAQAVKGFADLMDGEKGTKGWKDEDVEKAYYLNAKKLFG